MSLEERLAAVREELRALLREAGPSDGLPTPEFRTADQDAVPGAVWRTGWRFDRRDVEVLASADDAGSDLPCVFVRGITWDDDLVCLTPDDAVRIGRALLAAAAMTGSELIRQQVEARSRRRPTGPRRAS